MRMTYGNCVKVADEKTWDTWGNQINNALFGGKVDFIGATLVLKASNEFLPDL